MRTGKTEGVKNLVEEVLASLPEELMTEDVTDEVLFAVEEEEQHQRVLHEVEV